MLLPPKSSLTGKSYFDMLCNEVGKYIPEVTLDFAGYSDLVNQYLSVSENDTDANYELSKVFNAWYEYFSELAILIQNRYLDAETDKLSVQSEKSILASDKNVSAGDRKANTEPEVIYMRKKRNALKSLYDALIARSDFCEKAFYQCKHNCMNATELAALQGNYSGRERNYM